MIGLGKKSVQRLHANQPDALQQINEQERARNELRLANRVGIEKSAYQGQSECFTMSRTLMDTHPTPLGSEPESQSDLRADRPMHDSLSSGSTPALAPVSPAQPSMPIPRESAIAPFAEIFVGTKGLYPGARWVIYLAMAYITFEVLNFLLSGLRPEPVPTWWTMVTEARMMLAVILP